MVSPVQVMEIQERGQRFVPRSDLVDSSGRSLILPETRELKALEVRDTPEGAMLLTLGLIGYLPLTRTITLNIVPRFPIDNLWTMLEVGGENYRNILPTLRRYQTSSYSTPIHLLARSFCHYLREVVSVGFERSYCPHLQSSYFRPRVEFGPTISQHVSRGNPVETVSRVFEFGLHNALNEIIKAACIRILRIVPRTDEWSDERHVLQMSLDTLQRVTEREPTISEFDLDQPVSFRVRPYYEGMLRIYQLLLTGGGIAFTFEPTGKELPSFLFKLEDIFERFVRQTFVHALRGSEAFVLDGNKHQGRLFEDSNVYRTKSDLIFRRVTMETIAVGEVKYKPRLREADRYQIVSHATAWRVPVGILFTPASEEETQRLERIGRVSTGAEIYHYRVDLRGDIRESQAKMIEDICPVLPITARAS